MDGPIANDSLPPSHQDSQDDNHSDPHGVDARSAKKRVNPLVDLIETEKSYVELLGAIIRRVASAWSRTNFPPPELDAMFRAIESVYRTNRSLVSRLKEIGPNPSSPKALGDLLMRWIDDLEGPYARYCDAYLTSFDTWEPVQSNPNLAPILGDVSAAIPPSSYSSTDDPYWTLDSLFLIPATRIKYYKKLYTRLLKSTQPGRSDHNLLLGANERLVRLLATVDARSDVQVGSLLPTNGSASHHDSHVLSPLTIPASAGPTSTVDSPVISPLPGLGHRGVAELRHGGEGARTSEHGSVAGSSSSGRMSRDTEGRDSRESAPTSSNTSAPGRTLSTSTLSTPIVDLERRLSTNRVLDIFTMTPKKCRLQMAPPNLTYTRKVRFSKDVIIHFTPRSTEVEVVHRDAHIFLLTDLFLICERMSDEDRNAPGNEGFDMWLCYPPLAAKHLTASELVDTNQENLLQIQIMKKETLIVVAETRSARDSMLRDFRESHEEALTLSASRARPSNGTLDRAPSTGQPNPPASAPPYATSRPLVDPSNRPLQPPLRARTQSPPNDPTHDATSLGLNDPPRPQFGRLAAGSDPNLPESIGQPQAPRAPSEAPLFLPPPRGASRVQGPPAMRPPSNDSFAPSDRTNQDAPLSAGPHDMQRKASAASTFSLNGASSLSHDHDGPRLPPIPQTLPPDHIIPPPRGLSKSPSTPSLRQPPNDPRNHALPVPQQHSFYNERPHAGPSSWNGHSPNQPHFPNGNGMQPGPPRSPGPPSLRSMETASIQSRQPSLSSSTSRPSRLQMGFASRQPSPDLDSPPTSPDEDKRNTGPVTSVITAQMKCKVFLKQQHAQWKSLGSAKLVVYQQQPTNVKQLVVEADNKVKTLLISTIVLTDAVERVGKTGVAIELSDGGQRTGIVYMIQLKSDSSASGFFSTLLAGSDRAAVSTH